MTEVKLVPADSEKRLSGARQLFREYAAELSIDLCFQHFEQELAALPGAYAPPAGRLLLAEEKGELAGCVALRKLAEGVCELKRLYVRPAFRGRGLGRSLTAAVIEQARFAGYRSMRLDTLPILREALGLYSAFGFKPIAAYCHNPIPGAIYLELDLKQRCLPTEACG